MKIRTNFLIDELILQQLKILKIKTGVSVTHNVDKALKEFLKKQEETENA